MKLASLRWSLKLLVLLATSVLAFTPRVSEAQLTEWGVFMKSAPCAETLRDWMTVADFHNNPSGGGNMYEIARHPQGSSAVKFPKTPAGFTTAHLMADTLRLAGFMASSNTGTQADYRAYCCKKYSVWEQNTPEGKKKRAVLREPIAQAPSNAIQVSPGPMCCEDAAALAGGTGGTCSLFRLSNGRVIRFTEKGPEHLGGAPLMIDGRTIPSSSARPTGVCQFENRHQTSSKSFERSGIVSNNHTCRRVYTAAGNRTVTRMEISRAPTNGTLTITAANRWTYQPKPGYTGQDSFVVDAIYNTGTRWTFTYMLTVL